MNIAYLIYSNKQGTGGHHHSLKAICDIVESKNKIFTLIINIGEAPSPVIKSDSNYIFLKHNEFLLPKNIIKVIKICKAKQIDILHAFDSNAYFFARISSFILNIPSLYIKCGGSNNKYNPSTENAIATSLENYDFLKLADKHLNLYLIENRIPRFNLRTTEASNIKKDLFKSNELVFLRISRITEYYKSSLFKTIDFVSLFHNSALVIIGSIYDNSLETQLKERAKDLNVHLEILNSNEITKNAKEYLEIGDYLFGTGRAAMEIMSVGKPLLSFAVNSEYPIIVNDNNFKYFRYYNFSERVIIDNVPPLKKTQNYIYNNKNKDSNNLKKQFAEHYLVDSKKEDFIKIYTELYLKKGNNKMYIYDLSDFFVNLYHHFMRSSIVIKQLFKIIK